MNPVYDVNIRAPEQVKAFLIATASELRQTGAATPVTPGLKGIILSCLDLITAPGDTAMMRHAFMKYVFGILFQQGFD
jgi:hypothetical protein